MTDSFENLKKQAKTMLKAWRAGDPDTLARIRSVHPQHNGLEPHLTHCQLVLARELGFDSWPQLKVALQTTEWTQADEFVEIGCLCYDDPHYDHRSFHVRARRMLADNPALSEAHIWSAATASNTIAVKAFLDKDPQLVNAPGPHGWTPLLCACYSRVQPINITHSTYEVAKLLLNRGADPNTFTNKGNADTRFDQPPRRFTALTGLFGGGSTGIRNQTPHPRWRDMAELLLTHGAKPNDEQALKINQDASLEILLRHGLDPQAMGSEGITLMGRALSQAARQGRADQIELLLAHHARTDEKFNGKLPWEHAIRLGRLVAANLLEEAGAPTADLDDTARFVAACMAGEELGAFIVLTSHPDVRSRAPKDMVHRAVWTRQTNAVKLVLELGFDPNYQEDNPPITETGALAANPEILPLLLAHGASLTLRDPWYDSTAVGWADFFDESALRDKLLNLPGICLFDALDHNRLGRLPDILDRDPAALNRLFSACLSRPPKPVDEQTPLDRMLARGNTEAANVLLRYGAKLGNNSDILLETLRTIPMSNESSLSRRTFLTLAAAAPLAFGETTQTVPIGLELYSVRTALKDDLFATVKGVAAMGYQCVEFYAPYYEWTNDYAHRVRALLDDTGLRCYSTHNGLDALSSKGIQRAIELNKIIGAKYVVLAHPGNVSGMDGWKRVTDVLNTANTALAAQGLHAGYHNHDVEWKPIDGVKPMEAIARDTDKTVMLQLDVGTCVEAGSDPVAWIQQNPGRIKSVHLKDWSPDLGYKALFAEGKAPWKKIFDAAQSTGGVEFYLMEQEGSRLPEMETAEQCLTNYRKLIAAS